MDYAILLYILGTSIILEWQGLFQRYMLLVVVTCNSESVLMPKLLSMWKLTGQVLVAIVCRNKIYRVIHDTVQ